MMRKFIIAILAIIPAFVYAKDVPYVMGRVYNEKNEPMSAVVIEQVRADAYAVTLRDGSYEIHLEKRRKPLLRFSFVGYHTEIIDLNTYSYDSLVVHMTPLSIPKEPGRNLLGLPLINGLMVYLGTDYMGANFNGINELPVSIIEQLNKHHLNMSFGFTALVRSIYTEIGFSISPTKRYLTETYRSITDAYHITFNLGYAFGLYQKDRIILTPYAGITHLSYINYIAPPRKSISLDELLQQSYVNTYMLQYVGTIGANLDFKIAQIRNTRHSFYGTLGVGYNFPMHKHPYITSVSTKITTPNSLSISQLYLSIKVKWMFGKARFRK